MNNNFTHRLILLGAVALMTVGCSSSMVEATYGDAVRGNASAQIYDPETAANPSRDPVDGSDGQRLESAMESHRGQKGSAEGVASPIVINVGN